MATNVMGQAAGGVFATLCQLVCLLYDAHPTDSALLYFGIATVVLIITQICFWILIRMVSFRSGYRFRSMAASSEHRRLPSDRSETFSKSLIKKTIQTGDWIGEVGRPRVLIGESGFCVVPCSFLGRVARCNIQSIVVTILPLAEVCGDSYASICWSCHLNSMDFNLLNNSG